MVREIVTWSKSSMADGSTSGNRTSVEAASMAGSGNIGPNF